MAQIKVTITIPETEYKQWDEFRTDGVQMVMQSLRNDLSQRLREDFIKDFDINTEYEK
jgi:hypothetical protein